MMTASKPSQIVPKLRFPEFQNTPGWSKRPLGKILKPIVRERKKPTVPYTGLGIRSHGRGTFRKELEQPEKTSMERLYEVDCNDLIVNITFAWEGAIAIVRPEDSGALVSHRFPTYQFFQNAVLPEFFRYPILDKRFIYSLGVISPGGAGRNRVLNKADFLKIELALPEIAEQQKIADCLGSLDDLIAAEGRKLEALRQHKQGLMQQLFPLPGETVPRLRFTEFRETPDWEEREVGEVFEVTRGKVLAMSLVKNERTDNAPYPVYSSQTKNVGLAGYFSEYLYEDAITWTTDGANAGEVNYRTGKFYCTNVCGVLINDKGFANPFTASLINSVSRNHVSYVGNPKLMNGVMAKIRVAFPSLPEQQRIAEFLSSLDVCIVAHSQKLDVLRRHKWGLLQQLFPSLEQESL